MPYYEFLWTDEVFSHIAAHGLSSRHGVCRSRTALTGLQMDGREVKRVSRELTPAERARLERYRAQIAEELPDLAARDQIVLDDFLTGERTLRSDVMDRLTSVLGYQLHPAR